MTVSGCAQCLNPLPEHTWAQRVPLSLALPPALLALSLVSVGSGTAAMAKPQISTAQLQESAEAVGTPLAVGDASTESSEREHVGVAVDLEVAADGELEVVEEVEIEVQAEPVQSGESAVEPRWAGTLELYGFAPLRTSIDTDIGAFSASDSISLPTLLDNLKGIVSFRASMEYERIGLLTDISYISLGKNRTNSVSRRGPEGFFTTTIERSAELSFDQGIYDLALRYRFGERERAVARRGDYTLIPYAGIRVLDITSDLSVDVETPYGRLREFDGSAGSPIVQPLIGLQGQVFMTPKLRLFARGDLGGLNIGSEDNLSANAQIGVGYAIGNSTQLNLSWRYLYLQQDQGGSTPRSVEIRQNGVELGLKFYF